MSDKFAAMTTIGEMFGTTSHKLGKWLTELGLRRNGKPTRKAFEASLVEEWPSTQPGTWFYAWHVERTVALLVKAGHKMPSSSEK